MRVGELLQIPELKLTPIVHGDLDREINWVHAIDLFPASEFMSAGDVALTTGQWWPQVSAREFVRDLRKGGLAALGCGLTVPLTAIASELVAACEEEDFTYFIVPIDVPFIAIAKRFIASERTRWELPLRQHLHFYETFAAALRRDRSITSMLDALSAEVGTRVGMVADRSLYGVEEEERYPIPMEAEGIVDASLIVDQDPQSFDDRQRAAIAVATPLIALEIERIRSVRRATDAYSRELFSWLDSGDVPATSVTARLESLGIRAQRPLRVLAARSDDLEELLLALRRAIGDANVVSRVDDTAMVCASVDSLGPGLEQLKAALPANTMLGAGAAVDVDHLRLSYIQAKHALEIARRRGYGAFVDSDELNSPSAVILSEASDVIREISTALLRPLVEYDETRGGQLLRTLEVFLAVGGRWSSAATELFIHPNTLRYRIQLIEDITGRNLDRTRDRTDFDVALAVLRGDQPSS